MTQRLLVTALPGETRVARLDGDRLVDLAIARGGCAAQAGDLYAGRVAAVDRGLQAAFVELGGPRPGFLPLAEAPAGLSEGTRLVVRVTRAGAADKGPRLTARPGRLPEDLAVAPAGPPGLLRAADDPVSAALALAPPPEAIVVDDPALFARLSAELAARPALRDALALDSDPRPLFERAGVEALIEDLLQPRVALAGGGDLLIEPVRSLTAIDVNGGARDARDRLGLGLEAAAEIARQIRLRRLSGLIVVDFVAPREAAARRRIVAALADGLADDPQPHRVSPMRRSGLVEITRRRAGPALHEVLTEPCGLGGGGRVKSAATLAFAALRALRREAAANPGRRPALVAPPAVIRALTEGPAAAARAALEARLGLALTLHAGAADAEPEVAFRS